MRLSMNSDLHILGQDAIALQRLLLILAVELCCITPARGTMFLATTVIVPGGIKVDAAQSINQQTHQHCTDALRTKSDLKWLG